MGGNIVPDLIVLGVRDDLGMLLKQCDYLMNIEHISVWNPRRSATPDRTFSRNTLLTYYYPRRQERWIYPPIKIIGRFFMFSSCPIPACFSFFRFNARPITFSSSCSRGAQPSSPVEPENA